jgi:predicted DCC family thiol-disulfide oxidoreductase YuxK
VLYDGRCGFCDASVQWLLAHDPSGQFKFAPLEGETAAAMLRRHPLPPGLDSIVLIQVNNAGKEQVSYLSKAIFNICLRLAWPWRAVAWFGVLPRGLTDLGYRLFARYRYLVWGRLEACRLPQPNERERFLP